MPVVKPSQNHPWGYRFRHGTKPLTPPKEQKRPLRIVLTGIIENWKEVEIPLYYRGRFDSYSLLELPDEAVANWLIKTLKNYTHYATSEEEEEIPYDGQE